MIEESIKKKYIKKSASMELLTSKLRKNSEIDHELRESNSAIKNDFFDFLDDYNITQESCQICDFESARNYVFSRI